MEKPAPKRILISGYYGFGNTGDEAILSALLKLLRRSHNAHITVISAHPQRTAQEHGVHSISRLNPLSIVQTIAGADLLISGGGGLLQDVTSSRSLLYYLSIIRLGCRGPRQTVLLAQSIGPIRTPLGRRLTAQTLERVNLITVRDEASAQELVNLGVTTPPVVVTADLALLLERSSSEREGELLAGLGLESEPFLLFCLRRLKNQPFPLDLFVTLARRTSQDLGTRALFLPFQTSFDLPLARALHEAVPGSVFIPAPLSPPDLISLFSHAQVVVGMRLHSLIFAAKARTPFLPLAYDPKVTAFARLFGFEALTFSDLTETIFFGKIAQVWENRGKIREDVAKQVERLERKAEENWACLKRLVPDL
ncbi:MAG: polysaccharide pyruvyl transferase CsaB [bacterium]